MWIASSVQKAPERGDFVHDKEDVETEYIHLLHIIMQVECDFLPCSISSEILVHVSYRSFPVEQVVSLVVVVVVPEYAFRLWRGMVEGCGGMFREGRLSGLSPGKSHAVVWPRIHEGSGARRMPMRRFARYRLASDVLARGMRIDEDRNELIRRMECLSRKNRTTFWGR